MTPEATTTAAAEHDAGRLEKAAEIYRAVLATAPTNLDALIGLGDVLSDAGQLLDAEQQYRWAITMHGDVPAIAAAYDGIAAILQGTGDLDGAVQASKKAVELRGDADETYEVASTFDRLGRRDDAGELYILSTAQKPGFTAAHIRAAQHLLMAGKAADSIPHYQAAIAGSPEIAELHCNLANALRSIGQLESAMQSIRRAIELKPAFPDSQNVLGAILKDLGQTDDAKAAFQHAIELKPDFAEAINNLASVIEQNGEVERAGQLYARAVAIAPQAFPFHQNLAANCLLRGDFAQGWKEYEWRQMKSTNPGSRKFAKPRWDGSPLDGKTIVLYAEQGFGDTIQYIRYASLVKQMGGRVIVECQVPMLSLVQQVDGVTEVFAQGDPWPEYDVQCALLSLPLIFETELESIPALIPYITADADKTATWNARLLSLRGRKVGLAWAGSATHENDKNRSMPAAYFAPLSGAANISFISLQKRLGDAPPESLKLMDPTAELDDFSDTAALIANLDLVITVDTAVAHLAGAMGKLVWLLLPTHVDCRWMLNRENSPWYPTARLFRQKTAGDWTDVIARVRDALLSTPPR